MASNDPGSPFSLADIAKKNAKPGSILPPADPFPAGTRAPGTFADPGEAGTPRPIPPVGHPAGKPFGNLR
jgi:hypothetical protein